MTYFKNIKSLEDLKNQFKILARTNHPDSGGNVETMKSINCEYDRLFPIWKHRRDMAEPQTQTAETADSTRSEFYTQNGWKGENYNSNQSLKEIAVIIRAYVKELYPTYKFSVRTSYASMCQELHVKLKEAPKKIYKDFFELNHDEILKAWSKAEYNRYIKQNGCLDDECMKELDSAYKKHHFMKVYTDDVAAMLEDVDRQVNSYNYDDSDAMIDYFHVKFYYFGCAPDDLKIVSKTARVKKCPKVTTPATTSTGSAEYEVKEDAHTKTGARIWVVKLLRTLTRDEYLKESAKMKEIGGYYSKYKHGFIFPADPTELLKNVQAA